VGREAQSYDINLKGISLRKYSKGQYSHKEKNYRALSLPMHLKAKMTNVMKISAGEHMYNDIVGEYSIEFVCLKLCIKDVLELQECFSGKPQKEQGEQDRPRQLRSNSLEAQPAQPYMSHAKHRFNITKLSIAIGLSELPVPLLSFTLTRSESKIELIGKTIIITNKLEPTLEYWNMLIGRWEPVLEKSLIDELTLRTGKETYCSMSATCPLLFNFSTEAIKALRLISKDIAEKGEFKALSRSGQIMGMHVSPYALTNRTGHCIFLENSLAGEVNNMESNKLKNNITKHIYNKALELEENLETVKFEI
jgi:hypothetical protein